MKYKIKYYLLKYNIKNDITAMLIINNKSKNIVIKKSTVNHNPTKKKQITEYFVNDNEVLKKNISTTNNNITPKITVVPLIKKNIDNKKKSIIQNNIKEPIKDISLIKDNITPKITVVPLIKKNIDNKKKSIIQNNIKQPIKNEPLIKDISLIKNEPLIKNEQKNIIKYFNHIDDLLIEKLMYGGGL